MAVESAGNTIVLLTIIVYTMYRRRTFSPQMFLKFMLYLMFCHVVKCTVLFRSCSHSEEKTATCAYLTLEEQYQRP